mgnify:CR=1 FL=1
MLYPTELNLLNSVTAHIPTSQKIKSIHKVITKKFSFIHRVSVVTYDQKLDLVKTYVESSDETNPLTYYSAKLSETKSLQEIALTGKPRIVNDLSIFSKNHKKHSKALYECGYQSSYTAPLYQDKTLLGFVYFNSRNLDAFQASEISYLNLIVQIISLLIIKKQAQFKTLQAALKSALIMSEQRDPETAEHLERMARYSRLIAKNIALDHHWDDEQVELIFMCAPLHDLGKIAIPDNILRKPGKLTDDEFEQMKTHTTSGRQLIDSLLTNFDLEHIPFRSMLTNIIELHHESLDGSGYPHGLCRSEIPIEARIIAVADIFDALTSKRTYKKAWTNEEAFTELRKLATWKLDAKCVEALYKSHKEVQAIQATFRD